jgi:hypothetical protein
MLVRKTFNPFIRAASPLFKSSFNKYRYAQEFVQPGK